MAETTVTRNDETSRYEIHVDGELGGHLRFKPLPGGRVLLPGTELDPAFRGHGLGSKLAGEALADLARRGDAVVPVCPFVVRYVKENEVAGLVIEWPDEDDAADAASPTEPA